MYAGNGRKSATTLFGKSLASITQNQSASRAPSLEPVTSHSDNAATASEGTSPDDIATPSGMLPFIGKC